MRVLVWTLVWIGGLAAVVCVVGFVWFSRVAREQVEEVERFAANATQADCADETARRALRCQGLGVRCMAEVAVFAPGCMTLARRGDGRGFCASLPPAYDFKAMRTWGESFCPPRGLEGERCRFLTAQLWG